MQRISLAVFILLVSFYGCKKKGSDIPSSVGEDHILTSFRVVDKYGDHSYQFDFDVDDRPTKVRKLSGATTVASAVFSYGDDRLVQSVGYSGEPGSTLYEIIDYNYDSDGLLISDQTTNASGSICNLCAHEYEYDAEGRISRFKLFNSFYRRVEYDEDGNAVKTYFKPLYEPGETLELEFLKYDKLAPFFGVDSTMRIILRSMFWSSLFWPTSSAWTNTFEFPVPAFANNVTKMRWNPRPHPQAVSLKRDLKTQLQYNEDGYPVKATVTFSKQFEGSPIDTWTVYLTYRKLE